MAEALAAGAGSRLRTHPGEHPFPGCFGCGPDRAHGDGLRVLVGPVAGRDLSADVWYPDETLAGPDGLVRPEFLWAALDCAGGIALADASPSELPHVLGRFSARQLAPVSTGEAYVVTGWRIAEDGRKLTAGSALFTAAGQPVGTARATWIRLSDPWAGRGDAIKALPPWNQSAIVCPPRPVRSYGKQGGQNEALARNVASATLSGGAAPASSGTAHMITRSSAIILLRVLSSLW